ncbi:hypothetical protein M3Y98_00658200 [Aphelenchoides besseyi]|nr:hypothetical protein M3Y98_00658200 [Aphelenchoides besseyi]KAI6208770.1 hypothetical protein M3Y96_00150000 [Aphelenchoides besseyi]
MQPNSTPNPKGKAQTSQSASTGRSLDFIAYADHAQLADTTGLSFTEHVNREGSRIFELNTGVTKTVRHIAQEVPNDPEFDYCVAFYDRTTRETTFKPVSFLRIDVKSKSELDKTGLLEGKRKRALTDYTLNKSMNAVESAERLQSLSMEFGNTKKKRMLEAQERRKLDDSSIGIMSTSLNESAMDTTQGTSELNGTMNGTADLSKDFSMLKAPESMVLPKINKEAKSVDEIFDMKDFFNSSEELDLYKRESQNFFNTNDTDAKLQELNVPKFISVLITDTRRRNDLYRAVSLRAAIFSRIMVECVADKINKPKNVEQIPGFPAECVDAVLRNFLTEKKGGYMAFRINRDSLFSYLAAMYMTLNAPDYIFPMSPAVIELSGLNKTLSLSEAIVKKLCIGLGCICQAASTDQMQKFRTANIARLIGFTGRNLSRRSRGRGR